MPQSAQNAFYRILVPVPFVLGICILVAWLLFHQSVTGFLSLFIAIPAAFIQMAVLGFMLWLRPSIRLERQFTAEDALWYFGTFAAWVVGAALPTPWGGFVMIAAFVIGGIGMSRIGQRSRDEAVEAMTARSERMREYLGGQPGSPLPDASGPGAGKVIIVDTDTQWEDAGPASNPGQRPIEGEILDEPEDRDPDTDEWQARPHSN